MRFDLAIVGAGTAGAGAAWQCARRGMKVVCVDARPLAEAGARWINGVALWQLDAAGVPRPEPPELFGEDEPFHLVAGWGPERVVMGEKVGDRGVVEMDMRSLVARLQRMAAEQGAELRGGVRVRGLEGDRLDTSAGPIHADHVVDASGLGGAKLMPTPPIPPRHICAAAQAVHELADRAAAKAFFDRHGVPLGHTLCFSGVAGGYSILNARLEGDTVSILTGSIPADGHPSGRAMLDRFVAEHGWIGPAIFGGARTLPVRRPFDRLARGRVALLGDAASQIFAAHGSGIGVGLIAGRMLTEALEGGRGLAGYEREYLRRHGGLLAAYDVFRRFSQTLDAADIEALMRAGLINSDSSSAATAQRWPKISPATISAKLGALRHAPRRVLTGMSAVFARMIEAALLYRVYPGPDGRRGLAWSRAVARVVGDPRSDLDLLRDPS